MPASNLRGIELNMSFGQFTENNGQRTPFFVNSPLYFAIDTPKCEQEMQIRVQLDLRANGSHWRGLEFKLQLVLSACGPGQAAVRTAQLTVMLRRNSMLLPVFFSLFSINSMASTGGTPVSARRRITTLLYSSG
jgi:hypothetical protein